MLLTLTTIFSTLDVRIVLIFVSVELSLRMFPKTRWKHQNSVKKKIFKKSTLDRSNC